MPVCHLIYSIGLISFFSECGLEEPHNFLPEVDDEANDMEKLIHLGDDQGDQQRKNTWSSTFKRNFA